MWKTLTRRSASVRHKLSADRQHSKAIRMNDELAEIRDFIAGCPPFDTLAPAELGKLTAKFVIRYLRRGTSFPPPGKSALWLIRQGAIELRTPVGALARRMGEGDRHDADCLADSPEAGWPGHAIEDTLLYGLPQKELEILWQQHPELRQAAMQDLGQRLRQYRSNTPPPAPERDLGSLPLATLITRPPVFAQAGTSIREGALLMTRERVSALLIIAQEKLCGIVTDRDLRSRCLAAGLPDSAPLTSVMTANPCTLPSDAAGFEALLEMTRRGIHHLPVMLNGWPLGLISSTDLLRVQGVSSVYLADRIRRAGELSELVRAADELPELWLNLARRGESPPILSQVVSSIADAIAGRLLQMAESRLGPPPVPYAWIAFGSQGRKELTLHSDQDNALILAEEISAPNDADYFAQLAQQVCDGLAICGFVHCPGGMMASNPQWRLPPDHWRALFIDWMTYTDPQKARLASNLFDFRVVHGDAQLAEPLRQLITGESPRHETLLAHLINNGCSKPPPLGLFRNFVVDSEGAHEGGLDIKRHGILPIVDLARIHALAAGISEIGTLARLRGASASRLLSRDGAESLIAAFEFLLSLRTRHQKEQLLHALKADNFIVPATLTAAERQQLRDTFLAIGIQQKALLLAYPQAPTQ